MALKLVRHAGTITASTMGDDAAHGVELGKLVRGHAVRVSEFAGNDIFIKVTSIDAQTAVTATNGMYLKGGTTITVVPEGDRPAITGDDGKFFIVQDTAANAGDKILNEDDSGGAIIINAAEEAYFLSAINETAGSDAGKKKSKDTMKSTSKIIEHLVNSDTQRGQL